MNWLDWLMQNPDMLEKLKSMSMPDTSRIPTLDPVIAVGHPQVRGGLMDMPGVDAKEEVKRSRSDEIMSVLNDPRIKELLQGKPGPQLQGAGIGQMDIRGLLTPFTPQPVSLAGLFGGAQR